MTVSTSPPAETSRYNPLNMDPLAFPLFSDCLAAFVQFHPEIALKIEEWRAKYSCFIVMKTLFCDRIHYSLILLLNLF